MEPFQNVARRFGPSALEGLPVSALPDAPVLPVVDRRRTAVLATVARAVARVRPVPARRARLLAMPRPAVQAGCPQA